MDVRRQQLSVHCQIDLNAERLFVFVTFLLTQSDELILNQIESGCLHRVDRCYVNVCVCHGSKPCEAASFRNRELATDKLPERKLI